MSSKLASQLQKLQQRPVDSKVLASSFLFSESDAKSFSREQIHQMAISGLQTLVILDNRFHFFLDDLFSSKGVRQERRMLHTDQSRALDLRLEHCLALLGPHLFLTAAQQVFEYLVRVHEVHVYNVDAVLRAFLPYHDHNIFARALLLLDLRDTGLDFLSINQERGAPLLREHLIIACAESRKVLRLVCMTMAMPARLRIQSNAANALFASVAVSLATHTDAEAIWRVLLPFVVEFLSGKAEGADSGGPLPATSGPLSRDAVCAALLVLAAWSAEVRFSLPMMTTVMKPLLALLAQQENAVSDTASGFSAVPLLDLLLVVDTLIETQPSAVRETGFAPHVASLLGLLCVKWIPLLSSISSEAEGGAAVVFQSLSTLLSQFCLERLRVAHSLTSVPAEVGFFLHCASTKLPLTEKLVAKYLHTILLCDGALCPPAAPEQQDGDEELKNTANAEQQGELFVDIVTALERRYPRAFDRALSHALSDPATSEAAQAFLAAHLEGTRYQIVDVAAVSAAVATQRLPLFACLLHPLPAVRVAAAATLDRMTAEQLFGASSWTGSSAGESGSSLVELLAYVAQYETNHSVAQHFVRTGALALEKLSHVMPNPALLEGSAQSESADSTFHTYAVVVRRLLRSLHIMASQIGVAIQSECLRFVLTPLMLGLLHPHQTDRQGLTKTVAGRDSAQSATWCPPPAMDRACISAALYYALQLYVSLAGVTPPPQTQDTATKKREKTAVDGRESAELMESLEATLLHCFPALAGRLRDDTTDAGQHRKALAVLEEPEVMRVIASEAADCLPGALDTAHSLLEDKTASATQIEATISECVVAVAASLVTGRVDAADRVLKFLVGFPAQRVSAQLKHSSLGRPAEGQGDTGDDYHDHGYLGTLQRVQQAAASLHEQETKLPVGRAAPNNNRVTFYLPSNAFTERLGVVVAAAVRALLRCAANGDTDADVDVACSSAALISILQLLGYLKAPFPTLADHVQVAALSPAFLHLLCSSAFRGSHSDEGDNALASSVANGRGVLPVDWCALVRDAVLGPTARTTPLEGADLVAATATWGPLAVCLFLPLCTPPPQRAAVLQRLQGAVAHGTAMAYKAKKRAPADDSSASLIFAALSSRECTVGGVRPNVTALNSVIEALAREESRFVLTESAAELIGVMLAETQHGGACPLVPYRLSSAVVDFFFPLPSWNQIVRAGGGGGGGAKHLLPSPPRAFLPLHRLLPCVERLLKAASAPRQWFSTRPSEVALPRDGEDGRGLETSAADFVEAICRRAVLFDGADVEADLDAAHLSDHPAVRLCILLLRHPFLWVRRSEAVYGGGKGHGDAASGSAVRSLYPHALTALAVAFQIGLDAAHPAAGGQEDGLIFRRKQAVASTPRRACSSDSVQERRARFGEALAACVAPLLLEGVVHIGSDVACLCVGTVGGWERIFLPFARDQARIANHLDALYEFLDALTPRLPHSGAAAAAAAAAWQPPQGCAVNNPLRYPQAMDILHLIGDQLDQNVEGGIWARTRHCLMLLRLVFALLRVAPAVQCDDRSDDESLLSLLMAVIQRFPIDSLCPLLLPGGLAAGEEKEEAEDAFMPTLLEGSHALVDIYERHVLLYVRTLTALFVQQPHALSEKDPRGAIKARSEVLKQGLMLMAALLASSTDAAAAEPVSTAADTPPPLEEDEPREHETLQSRVDVISELLRELSPLLAPLSPAMNNRPAQAEEDACSSHPFLMHIPLVALLVRLEPMGFTRSLRYQSAVTVCQEIITSFDVHTQINCITEMMRLVVDPHAQLAASAPQGDAGEGDDTAAAREGGSEEKAGSRVVAEGQRLFRKIVKPRQILSLQEPLLNVITTTIKSEAFLQPFIELQYRTNRTGPNAGARDVKREGGKAEDAGKVSGACMRLLVASLEMFSHYSDLSQSIPGDEATSAEEGDADARPMSEEKSYAMLLEVLAGNALACVLAGINESTFVECQLQLLTNSRTTIQLKGLEVLLDRLHHSLPTIEHTLSNEEVERHRKDLRDPKKKLSLLDLVHVKARPLTTKRSFTLMPNLTALLETSLQRVPVATKRIVSSRQQRLPSQVALSQLFRIVHLCVSCIEEIVRIVCSGGSLQAEKTLLNTSRGKRLTEALLTKLFGNKARLGMVHGFVSSTCSSWILLTIQGLRTLARTVGGSVSLDMATATQALHQLRAVAEEGLLATVASLLTALGTVTQVMGPVFISEHCIDILETVVSCMVYEVVDLLPVVARGRAGSLLRHTTLSCWIRCFPFCWQMCHPFLPRVVFAATHLINVDDADTGYLCTEVLAVLEALVEPQIFLEACGECLRGFSHVSRAGAVHSEQQSDSAAFQANGGASVASDSAEAVSPLLEYPEKKGLVAGRVRTLRFFTTTHAYGIFFGCVERRVRSLKRDELAHMSAVVGGTMPRDNFWLAALQSLAASPVLVPRDVVAPVLEAFTAFFLKFKAKQCTKFLRMVALWAFGGDAEEFAKLLTVVAPSPDGQTADGDNLCRSVDTMPRTMVHGWLLFFALFNHLLEVLGSILDFGYGVALPYVVTTLGRYCASDRRVAKPMASSIALVLEGALDSVRRMALIQTPAHDHDYSIPFDVYFATPEVFNSLMPVLVHHLTNLAYLADDVHDFDYRAEHVVIPAVRAFFACLNTNKLQAKTQAEIMRGLRHPSRHVRRMTLRCLDGIYADGGSELAARLMAEMLPSVVELTEDHDDAVVEESRRLCRNLSHTTGQDILSAMT